MGTTYIQYPQGGGGGSTGSGTGVPYAVGPLDGALASPNGGVIGSFSLYFQTATGSNPGLVSSSIQTFSGVKTFTNGWTSLSSASMGSNKLSNVLDPSAAQDAATKNYVDTQLAAFQPLEAVVAASALVNYPGLLVANVLTITATGAISIDGVTPSANDRVLLKDQTTGAQNGVFVVTGVGSVGVSPILTRAADYNTAAAVNSGASVPVLTGAVNKLTSWIQTATVVTINTDSLVFTQFSANPQNVPITIGTINTAAANLNGAVIGSSTLYLQAASAANPGLVSSASQTFAGVKTFSSAPNLSSLSASAQLALDSSKNIIVSSVSLTSQVTGNLPLSQTSGSLSLVNQVVGNLPLSQTSGSLSLTNQVVNNLPLSQTSGSVTFSQLQKYPNLTMGSVTQTSSVGGATYTLTWPGAQGANGTKNINDGAGNLSWQAVLTNPMTTLGDMIVGGASGVTTRFAVGGVGQVLVQNGAPTPQWVNPVTQINALINSGFDWSQEKLGIASVSWAVGAFNATYVSDQWYLTNTLGSASAVTSSMSAASLSGSINQMQVFVNTAPIGSSSNVTTGVTAWTLTDNPTTIALLYNGSASFSINVKPIGPVNQVGIRAFASAGSEAKVVDSGAVTLGSEVLFTVGTAAFTLCSVSALSVSSSTGLGGNICVRVRVTGVSVGSTCAINTGMILEQAMFNSGPFAAPWSRKRYTPDGEYFDCLRFYEKSYNYTVLPGALVGSNSAGCLTSKMTNLTNTTAANLEANVCFKSPKRISPSLTLYSIIGGNPLGLNKWYDRISLSEMNSTTLANIVIQGAGQTGANLQFTSSNTATVTSAFFEGHWSADARI